MNAPTLREFLLARIAEDERDLAYRYNEGERAMIGGREVDMRPRVAAECEAKRRIVEVASSGVAAISEGRPHRSFLSGRVHDSANILAALALPYAEHSDYREEWKP